MKLSIIVPVYNVAPYLRKCVDSLLAQDITDYEIILVDDGSPDECPQICDDYAEKYTNIKAIHQENAGLSEARNTGTRAAQGEYIMYVDSDDYLEPNVLGALMEQVEREQLDVLRFRYQNVRESGEAFAPYKDMTNYNDYSSTSTDGLTFLNERMGTQCYAVQFIMRTALARIELFTPCIYFEDVDWTPRMLLRAKRVASTELMVYNYLWREGSITRDNNIDKVLKKTNDKLYIIQKILQYSNRYDDTQWFQSIITGMVIGIVQTLSTTLYHNRKTYLRKIKGLNLIPLSYYHIAPLAKKKVKLINISIDIAIFILRIRFLIHGSSRI